MAQQKCSVCKGVGHKSSYHLPLPTTKTCCLCKQVFPVTALPLVNRTKADGTRVSYTHPVCAECNKRYCKARYSKGFTQRLSALARTARQRAVEKGIPYNIDVDYLLTLYKTQEGRCAYSGIMLSLEVNSDVAVTIDQINPSQGYTTGNVVLACRLVNNMKNSMNKEQFLTMCERVLSFAKQSTLASLHQPNLLRLRRGQEEGT